MALEVFVRNLGIAGTFSSGFSRARVRVRRAQGAVRLAARFELAHLPTRARPGVCPARLLGSLIPGSPRAISPVWLLMASPPRPRAPPGPATAVTINTNEVVLGLWFESRDSCVFLFVCFLKQRLLNFCFAPGTPWQSMGSFSEQYF